MAATNVLVVESAAKARTIQKYLGDGWRVVATGGHIETLPHDRARHGKEAAKAFWASRPGELPSPPWVWTERGEEAVRKILTAAGSDPVFWLATDPDREGELIAWRLAERLGEHGPTHRVSFDEVTEEAVRSALEHPRPVDMEMVSSALVRGFLDRLVGYRTSKMARGVVAGRDASMGRVQTPTLGFVVERELEREAHVPIPYFEVRAVAAGVDLAVRFHEPDDPAAWRDEAGKVHPVRTFDGELARTAMRALEAAARVTVTGATSRTRQRHPDPPMSTDVLLQAAGSRFGWSPGKTSALASLLYEAGHITYIRTDSTRLAASAVAAARAVITASFGADHVGSAATAKEQDGPAAGRVQDAHEAIRPTRMEVAQPDLDDGDARRLYRLIRAHTLASQMAPSQRTVVRIEAACAGLERPLAGSVSWRTFAGWEAAFAELMGEVATAPPAVELRAGAVWSLDPGTPERANPLLVEDATRPPPRYRPHTLIRAMKEVGIGRPSTYSRTVEKLEERQYVRVEDGAVAPTDRGRAVWLEAAPLYAEDPDDEGAAAVDLFSPEYTAQMEEGLDLIERGEAPAPASWEAWRDRIRALHELARERRDRGAVLPRQREMLERLLANAPAELHAEHAGRLGDLSYAAARELIGALRERGVTPAPTEAQRSYLGELVADLALGAEELAELTGLRSVDEVADSMQASAVLDELRRLHDERRPPSAKQRRFIADLSARAGLAEPDAAALVGAASFEELRGGREGSASQLIDLLQQRLKDGSAGA